MAAPTQPNQPNNPGGKPLNQAEARLYEQVKNSLRDINVATEQGRSKFRELVSVTDEWRKSLNDIAEDLENLDDNFTLINKNIREIGANIGKELTKELENAGDEADLIRRRIGDVKKLVNEAGNATRKAADLTQDFADGTARTSDIGKQIAKNNKTITQLLHEANDARERGNEGLATQLQKLIAEEEISQRTLETLKGQAEQIDKASGLTGKLHDGFKKIPLIGEVIGEELADINKELREEGALALKNGTKFNMMGAAAGKVGGLLKEKLKDPLVLMGFAVAGIVKTFNFLKETAFGFSKNVAETGRNMGLTRDGAKAAVEYTQYVSDHAHDIGVNMKTAGEAMGELNDSLGTSALFSTELIEGQVELKEKILVLIV
jgi:methyl-accepting chemotaxis protein